nr:hypothetical protein [Deltaproteobacteria bacterium]
MFKDLLDRAKKAAEEHLPEDILDAGRKLGRTVAAHAPAPLAEVIHYVTGEEDSEEGTGTPPTATDAKPTEPASAAPASEPTGSEAEPTKADADAVASTTPPAETAPDAPKPDDAQTSAPPVASPASVLSPREDAQSVLERVKAKADQGLKPEDRLVVVYATPEQAEDVAAIMKILETVEAEVRENDLRREPQTARQLAKLTGVMVPPYVFINGRFWGARYDMESLSVSGDLPLVVANRLDELSEEARRIGHIQESFSDELSVDNIVTRWRQGHILCVDDLDSWYEVDRSGNPQFFYQGGPRAVEDMRTVA